jgi:hypothetical protein
MGPSRKRKPDDLIAAVDRPSRGKKSTTQEEFEKLLQKKCPWHPIVTTSGGHSAIPVVARRTRSQWTKNPKTMTKGTKGAT